jgi:IclR family mhp operon transcriptional activator
MEKGVPIRSITRSITVLQAINRHGSLSMMEISREGRVPYPTACRIVQTLVLEGLIEQEPTRKHYRPTELVESLAHGYRREGRLVDVGGKHIRDLTRRIGWPVSLTVRVGTHMMVRDSTHGETSLTFERYYPGFTLPLLESASGRVCLAQMSAEEVDSVTRWIQLAGEEEGASALHDTVDSLQKIRDDGYAAQGWGTHNRTPGKTSSVAVPIFRDGAFEASLTMIYFAASMKQSQAVERYIEPLQAAAAAIGFELGAKRPDADRRRPAESGTPAYS